jgi:MerR family transcriptional regulator, light-induced transcriptional regulator
MAVSDQKFADSDLNASCADWVPPRELEHHAGLARKRRRGLDQQHSLLEQVIDNRIIPRLLLANRNAPPALPQSDLTAAKIAERVGEFSDLVINRDGAASVTYFQKMRESGATIEALFQDLLEPTARRLGVLWDEDINDFMDVTRGLNHLQQIVNEFSTEFRDEGRNPISNRRALLMPLPGEHHSFGISLIGEYFRREGWRVWGGPPQSIEDILELVDGQWFDVVGLSASQVAHPEKLEADIRTIRRASHNKHVTIMVGGRIFVTQPDLMAAVGADATAIDGNQAVLQVTELIGPSPKPV